MATFNVVHLITLIGVGSIASSVVVDVQQNQNKTAQNGGGGLKHLFGSDGVITELRDKQNALAEKMSGIETKLEKQNENGGGTLALMTMLTSNRLEKEIEDGMRENRNAMAEKMSGIEAKLEKQIENGMRDSQNLLSTKLENGMRENQNALAEKVLGTEAKLENQIENVFTKLRDNQNASVTKLENRIENGMRENQNALVEQIGNGISDSRNLLSTKLENGMRENQNAMAEKMSGIEAKLENQIENVFTKLRDIQNASVTKLENRIENGMRDRQNLLSTKLENGMRENQNAMVGKVSGTEAKLEKQIENVYFKLRDNQNVSVTKLENHIENRMRDTQNLLSTKLENGMRENQNLLAEKVSEIGTKLEQIENAIAEKVSGTEAKLENQIENGMRENRNAMVEKVSEIGAKLEQIETGMSDKQNAMAEKVSRTEAKLEKQIENVFNDLHNNQNGLATKLENEIQNNQKALSLMKNMTTLALFHFHSLPIYHRWNASDCHPEIVINESTNAIQRNSTGREDIGFCSCRAAPIHMPSSVGRIGIIYAEYRILAIKKAIYIGLSTKEVPLNKLLGFGRVSYGYGSDGEIESKNANGNYAMISDNVPRFDTGDVVGCGVNWAKRQVFFTKNGQRLNITNLYVDEGTEDLYPTVTLDYHGDAVEANFGPNFQYDLSKKF